jgi:hypothetical protein
LKKITIEHDNSGNKKSHRDPSSNYGYLHPAIIRICNSAATSSASLANEGLQKLSVLKHLFLMFWLAQM